MLIDTEWHSKLCYYLYYLLDHSNSLENCHFFFWGLEYTCIRNSAGWLVYKPIKSMNLLAIQEYLYFFFLLPWTRNRKKKREMLKDCNKQSWLAVFFHNKRRADVLNLFASDIMKLCWLHVYRKLFFPPTDWEWYIDNGRTRSTSGDTSCFRVSCGVYGVHR